MDCRDGQLQGILGKKYRIVQIIDRKVQTGERNNFIESRDGPSDEQMNNRYYNTDPLNAQKVKRIRAPAILSHRMGNVELQESTLRTIPISFYIPTPTQQ